ncbi:MAG TPA: hypothetical protein VHZ24_05280 [Pirellulales bacterium]|jgi:hypothetical protein|nr:hypothetical protein [Pirellulales bacterium]
MSAPREQHVGKRLSDRLFAVTFAVVAALLVVAEVAARADEAEKSAEAPTIDVASLRRKQQAQQRARELAGELVSRLLDVQLQQLEENGLDGLPLYHDIQQMRSHLDGLVEAEMNDVVGMLLRAQEQAGAEREATFVAARQKIRDVVVRLSVERQSLHRRLKTAELAAQVKRLIELETLALDATRAAREHADPQQNDAAVVSTAQDQRDVKALFDRLVASLNEVRGWGGEVGHGAAEMVGLVRVCRLNETIDSAITQLDKADLAAAVGSQAEVLDGLRMLLERIELAQGLVGADRDAAIDLLRSITQMQAKVRRQTVDSSLSDEEIDKLVREQATIQKEIGRLRELLDSPTANSTSKSLAEQAKDAAYRASANIFDSRRQEALAEQRKALGSLAALDTLLSLGPESGRVDKSAAALSRQVDQLERANESVRAAAANVVEARRSLSDQPADAKQALDRAAGRLDDAQRGGELPRAVALALEDARAATGEARASLDDPEAEPDAGPRLADEAKHAVDHARSEIETSLADTRRQRLALEIGELARASEAVARGAASQRQVAAELGALVDAPKLEVPKSLEPREQTIAELAANAARSVEPLAADVAERLQTTGSQAKSIADDLAADKPLSPAATGRRAEQVAASLDAAATALRGKVVERARALVEETDRQLKNVSPARTQAEAKLAGTAAALAAETEAGTPLDKQAGGQAHELAELAERMIPVDAGAQAAMRSAEQDALHSGQRQADLGEGSQLLEQAVTRHVERGVANLVLREHRLQQDRAMAESVVQAAEGQQRAATEIALGRAEPIGKKQASDSAEKTAFERLAAALEAFAVGQAQIGRAVQEMTGQRELANEALRRALDDASRMMAAGEPNEAGRAMGSQFFPASPEATARMMAGPEMMTRLAASQPAQGANQSPGSSSPTSAEQASATAPRPSATGESGNTAKLSPGDAPRGGDARQAQRTFGEEPWVAKLPPGLRQAIQAQARRPAPAAYEERLRRYFETGD